MASTKFEKLIEFVIANDEKKARALFHQIVVEKSRKIYEALDIDDTERAFDEVDADHTASGEEELGGDSSDDLQTDVFADGDEMGFDDGGEEEVELNPEIDDRVADLEQEFDALKAEFEELLQSDEIEDSEESDAIGGEEDDLESLDSAVEGDEDELEHIEDEAEDDESAEGAEESEEEESEEEHEEPVDESIIREYVLKVTQGLASEHEEGFVNKKSTVAGKNEIVKGVNAKNIAQSAEEKGRPAPKTDALVGEDEIQNRPGRKKVDLKNAPKPVTSKEESGVNKKSIES